MQQIPIQNLPNQSFFVILDNNRWDFIIKATDGCTSISLSLNGLQILDNLRATAGSYIIPDKYQEAGNFFFVTQVFQFPFYKQFGNTQFLLYVSAAELTAFRAKISPPITRKNFNPIADLPLRFSPKGY